MIKLIMIRSVFKIITIFLLSINLYSSNDLEKVTLQLNWKYQFEHAGFIAAVEKGFYKDAGFDVRLLEHEQKIDTVDEILSGNVDFGLSPSTLIVKDKKIRPVVTIATYFHKSPLVFVTRYNIKFPTQLKGKIIMMTKDELNGSPLSLLLEHFDINEKNSHFVPHTYNIEDFKNKKIDAMSAYLSNEIFELREEGIFYSIIDPSVYGFVINSMNLVTSFENVKKHPKKIKRFIDATNKGWKYALEHTDELINILHVKYKSKKSLEALKYEAKVVKELMLLKLYHIGEVDENLIKRVYKQLIRAGKLLNNENINKYICSEIFKNIQNDDISFSKEELDYLTKKSVIKLCVNPKRMPFEGIIDGKYEGMVAEYFKVLREKSGLNIKLYPTKSWNETVNAMKNRKCDIIASATPTPSRMKYMDFTTPYMESPFVLATKTDKPFTDSIESIKHKRLGVTKGYAVIEQLKTEYPDINLVYVKNIYDGLRKVERGEIYGYLDNLHVIVSNIQRDFNGILKVSARLKEKDLLTIASRNDEPLLHSIFQKAIKCVDLANVTEILNRWIAVKESVEVDYTFLWKILVFVAFVFLLFFIYSYQLRLNNKKLEILSHEDALTKVGNRLKLNEVLAESYELFVRYNTRCGIILIDIDNFKKINDTYGHLFGDEVLKRISQVLVQNVRKTDIVGRWGGEEFLIVCRYIKLDDLKKIAEVLRQKIEDDEFLKEKNITASFGLSIFDGTKDIDEVINEADENLYKAKSHGKNRVHFTS